MVALGGKLSIRLATHADRPDVERICAHTWEWGDYVPDVWDEWLADEASTVIVGHVEGRVVAVSSIASQPAGQVWLEGMRVDPEFRERGIAGDFLNYSLAHAREAGARVVRLATGSHNTAVHVLAGRAGLENTGSYVRWLADPLPFGALPTLLGPEHLAQVEAFTLASPVLDHTRGLYSAEWAWQELSGQQMASFLCNQQMAAKQSPAGDLAALATLHFDPEDSSVLWIGFADGIRNQAESDGSSAVSALALETRAHATHVGAQQVAIMLPDIPWLREAFQTAGFGFGDWEGELWVFERKLESAPGGIDGA